MDFFRILKGWEKTCQKNKNCGLNLSTSWNKFLPNTLYAPITSFSLVGFKILFFWWANTTKFTCCQRFFFRFFFRRKFDALLLLMCDFFCAICRLQYSWGFSCNGPVYISRSTSCHSIVHITHSRLFNMEYANGLFAHFLSLPLFSLFRSLCSWSCWIILNFHICQKKIV